MGELSVSLIWSSVLFIIYLEIYLYFCRDESKVIDYFKSISPFLRAKM